MTPILTARRLKPLTGDRVCAAQSYGGTLGGGRMENSLLRPCKQCSLITPSTPVAPDNLAAGVDSVSRNNALQCYKTACL